MKKTILFISCLFISLHSLILFGQNTNGAVKGIVTTTDNKPASGISIEIEKLKRGAISDANGRYNISNLPSGSYILKISSVGVAMQEREIIITAGVTKEENFIVNITSQQLEDVIVNANANKFSNTSSDYIAKMPLKDLENPQVSNTVTGELIKEQMLTNFNDVLKNVPGVAVLFANQAYGAGTYAVRGFSTGANLRNGLSGGGPADINLANIEKVEVLKGPAGTLFGSPLVSWGGLINRVTKKPYEHYGGEIMYSGGSYGLNRITADVNAPLNNSKTVLFRMNAAYSREGSFQDAGFTKSTFFAPVIECRPNDKLFIRLEAELYDRKGTTPFTLYAFSPMEVHSPKDLDLDYKRSFTNNEIVTHSPEANFFGEINYKLSLHWTSQTVISATNGDQNGPYLWNSFSSAKGDSITRTVTDWNKTANTTEIQQNFISDYILGNIRNRLVVGLDFYNSKSNNSNYYVPFDKVSLSNPGTEYLRLTADTINVIESTMTPSKNIANQNVYAAYVSDVLNLTDKLIINAALRVDRFDNRGTKNLVTLNITGKYAQTALSPKFGIVYQVIKDQLSLFSNYSSGFQNTNGSDFEGNAFKPAHGNQFEAGVKTDAFKHRLSATVSYYNIHGTNLTETDPDHQGFSIQDGEEWSKGIEASIIAVPVSGLNLVAGYSHNDLKWLGSRPNSAGPANTANFYVSYHFVKGKIKGLGFAFGANNFSKTTIVTNFTLPAYTLLNASAFYDSRVFRLGIKIDNLANKEYWTGWNDMAPQMLRRVSATAAIKF